ncbi:MAG: EamA/RhaT family transporter, partial [Terriglobia bacterium]
EQASCAEAIGRECQRYGLNFEQALAAQQGEDPESAPRRWWDALIVFASVGLFVWLAAGAKRPPIPMDAFWTALLSLGMLALLAGCGWLLAKRTGFS